MRHLLVTLALAAMVLAPVAGRSANALPAPMDELSALGDRSVGAPGCAAAADIVERALRQRIPSRLNPHFGRHSFALPIRHDAGCTISVNGGPAQRISPLRMNILSPGTIPRGGLTGRVIFGGDGSMQAMSGQKIEGAIVLMDLASGKNWQNAAMLGARALIYVDGASADAPAPRGLFEEKRELTPIDFPRFWMPRDRARELFGPLSALKGTPTTATLTARVTWRGMHPDNVYALIPGTDQALADQLVIAEAFYDSTAVIPGASPGADEASSIAALCDIAAALGRAPPRRSVLLVATAGRPQGHAGMRELTWALTAGDDELAQRRERLAQRAATATDTLALLRTFAPLEPAWWPEDATKQDLVAAALGDVVKNRVDRLSRELAALRLMAPMASGEERIRALAGERLSLRRLGWFQSTDQMTMPDRRLIASLVPDATARQRTILADATAQLDDMDSVLELRRAVAGRAIAAHVSLHLSSHGAGIGAFERGWLYLLRPDINRTRFLAPVAQVVAHTVADLPRPLRKRYTDMLRPSPLDSWQGYLPGRPELGAEPMALAGRPAITLATTHDARSRWGTPYDTPRHVDAANLTVQLRMVRAIVTALTRKPIANAGETMRSGFAALTIRANLLRQGEVFPDRPASDSIFLVFQAFSRFPVLVDAVGGCRVVGIADKKHSIHKAILEGFRFDQDTGRAVWAVDKPSTGKASYRVKMNRRRMETNLTMFGCAQSTLFEMLGARTFRYLYRPRLIDARTESAPLRYWYSRLDTRTSTLGTFFLEPDVPLKLTISDTVLDKKFILLNASTQKPTGTGYRMRDWPVVTHTPYLAARDMWRLITPRMRSLEERGIVSDRLRDLRRAGLSQLSRAQAAQDELRWDAFLDASRASLSIASQVYNDVDAMQKDVLVGVLFYIALFVPFAYCMERLVFGFTDITKRIVAFFGFLVAIIGIIAVVHPAFQLTYSPMVVILAFFIVGLSILVAGIIFFRFEQEMADLQRRAKHMKPTSISRMAAFSAAFVLGVSNLRRRPVRTLLTCATLAILTFTIMNFTAVKSERRRGWADFAANATYDGLLLKNLGWKDIPREALAAVADMAAGRAVVAPRAWYTILDTTRAPSVPVRWEDRSALARGIVGLSHTEPQVTSAGRMLARGRWFTKDEPHAVILPDSMARSLGIDPTSPQRRTVDIWGMPFTVTGTIADGAREAFPDLDGEPTTPIIYPSEADTRLSEVEAEALEEGEDVVLYTSRYQHIPGNETIIVPYATLMALGGGGGQLKAIALRPRAGETGALARDLGRRYGLMLFRGKTDHMTGRRAGHMGGHNMGAMHGGAPSIPMDDSTPPATAPHMDDAASVGTSLFYASTATTYSGVSSVLIPMLISICIVLNTMIGSVYERKGEIAVYTSVGLAPSHVSFLFIAEALAFGVISVVTGYLLAQGAAKALAGTVIWQGMTANYSSTAAVASMTLVLLVVLASAVYPSRVAAAIAIPDVTRSWTMPRPKGNELSLTLPFLIDLREQASAGGFLQYYYDAHTDVTHGLFSTDDMHFAYTEASRVAPWEELDRMGTDSCLTIDLKVWLAPFDFGVRQHVRMHFCPSEVYRGYMQIRLHIRREAGEHRAWMNANKGFLNDLRKQLLVWRSLDDARIEAFGDSLHVDNTQDAQPQPNTHSIGAMREVQT